MAYKRKPAKPEQKKTAEKREMDETLNIILDMKLKPGDFRDLSEYEALTELKGKTITARDALAVAIAKRAINGDLSAAEYIINTVGKDDESAKLEDVNGDRLAALEVLAEKLSRAIDYASTRENLIPEMSSLARQYRDITREIEEMKQERDHSDGIAEIIKKRAANGDAGAVRNGHTVVYLNGRKGRK